MAITRNAVKILSMSDLSLFRVHVKDSKQKAINLNSSIFVDKFYPALHGSFSQIPFGLVLFGPGGRGAHALSRMAVRSQGSKNWRLNGEVINNPDNEPNRYDNLSKEDFIILSFRGDPTPNSVIGILVSKSEDPVLHGKILSTLPMKESMVDVSNQFIFDLISATVSEYQNGHPLDSIGSFDCVEDAIFGPAPKRISNGLNNKISQDAAERQVAAASEVGRRGEELFASWLAETKHDDTHFKWVSREYARASFDFKMSSANWTITTELFVDVKSTRGPFENNIHMSLAEVRWAAAHESYRIARISDISSEKATITILAGVSVLCQNIIEKLVEQCPEGITIDSFQIDPSKLTIEHSGTVSTHLPGD
jgi:hypothetical protein